MLLLVSFKAAVLLLTLCSVWLKEQYPTNRPKSQSKEGPLRKTKIHLECTVCWRVSKNAFQHPYSNINTSIGPRADLCVSLHPRLSPCHSRDSSSPVRTLFMPECMFTVRSRTYCWSWWYSFFNALNKTFTSLCISTVSFPFISFLLKPLLGILEFLLSKISSEDLALDSYNFQLIPFSFFWTFKKLKQK